MTPNRPRLPSRAKYQPFLSSKGNDAGLTLEKPRKLNPNYISISSNRAKQSSPMKFRVTASLATRVSTSLLPQSPPRAPAPSQVRVLGTYHFGNPAHDMHNRK